MTPLASRKPARRALTLVELVAVLAVLAILASLAWPRLLGMLTRGELTEAGKRVRTALVQARLRAIESGQPWVFRFTPGSGRFEVLPAKATLETGLAEPDQDVAAPPAARQRAGIASLPSTGQRPNVLRPLCETLPGGVVFEPHGASALSGSEPWAALSAADAYSKADAYSEEAAVGHRPETKLLFQANGRAADARIVLLAPDGRRLEVAFRGLTGTATLGPLRKAMESAPAEEQAGPPETPIPGHAQREAAQSAPPADTADSDDTFWSEFLGEGAP